jgi:hypothetical protein
MKLVSTVLSPKTYMPTDDPDVYVCRQSYLGRYDDGSLKPLNAHEHLGFFRRVEEGENCTGAQKVVVQDSEALAFHEVWFAPASIECAGNE